MIMVMNRNSVVECAWVYLFGRNNVLVKGSSTLLYHLFTRVQFEKMKQTFFRC